MLCCFYGIAQEVTYNGNPDDSYFIARNLAFNGDNAIARDTLHEVLSMYPHYTDVRSLLASTYSWDGKYSKAREQFNRITSDDKENKEIWVATIKNEIYATEYHTALGLANKALMYLKNDADIDSLRIQVLESIHKAQEPTENKIKESIENTSFKNSITITNALDVFDIVFDPMVNSSISYTRETKLGSIIPRINYSNRFHTNGIQYELDLYPKISKTFYSYLNYGFSEASIFPNHRIGGELYMNLPKAMEASIGVRYLSFTDSNATIFTGSFGLYKGNYFFSLRPYVTPQSGNNPSISGNFLARKYLKDGDNYIGLEAGMGYSTDLRQLRDGQVLLAETLLFLETQRLRLDYQFTNSKNNNLYNVNLGATRQELASASGEFFWAITVGFSYEVKF